MQLPERNKSALLPPINGAAPAPLASLPGAPPWRPRSARTAPAAQPPPAGRLKWDPYESTMKHDFVFKSTADPEADCARAGTGHVIPFQVDEPTAKSIYRDEFCWKPYSKAEPITNGFVTVKDRNNPQPGERFLIWQLPREEAPLPTDSFSPWTKPFSKQDLEEVLKKQYKTVYTRDYLGMQPGAPRDDVAVPPDWKTLLPKPADTEVRRHYQPQVRAPELMDFTWKYGCNAKRKIPVKGAVPSMTIAQIWNHEHSKHLSTYQKDFGNDYLDILSVLNSVDPEEIKEYVERAPKPEKIILQNFLDRVSGDKMLQRLSSSKKSKENPIRCI
ncbi:testis-expressed protein 26 isoform X2 [Ahaetulla prasina]|uniref:testis-expressed protein 26 isoform X2 n=1 Tax=Ahaetulla prasina TaxID=499056 RepID=UPI0026474855|nr:testis-expressed protein 26 isoform X2 [Ahaetulla prasina]